MIAVAHHLDNVDRADKLLILGHGGVVWFGSRVEPLSHFDVHRLAGVSIPGFGRQFTTVLISGSISATTTRPCGFHMPP